MQEGPGLLKSKGKDSIYWIKVEVLGGNDDQVVEAYAAMELVEDVQRPAATKPLLV